MAIAQKVKFNFKSRKITGENGEMIGRTKKQPSIEVDIPVLDAQEIVDTLVAGGKEAELIQQAVARIVIDSARTQFDDAIEGFADADKEVTAAMLDYDKLTLAYIANLPPSQRGVTALSDDDWAAFFEDYLQVMVAATGKEAKRIANHIELFKKPNKAKANREVLMVLVDQLDIYLASSANLDDTGECAARIRNKFNKWATEPEKAADLSLL